MVECERGTCGELVDGRLVERGLHLVGSLDEEALREAEGEVAAAGVRTAAIVADVTKAADVERIVAEHGHEALPMANSTQQDALHALALLARLRHIACDPDALRHDLGLGPHAKGRSAQMSAEHGWVR